MPQIDLSKLACPNCCSIGMTPFFKVMSVPVHSVLLHTTRDEAITFPKGDINLAYCSQCEFVSNTSFNPTLQNYLSENYEATQAYSETFNEFHRNLASRLVDKYDLHGKKIVEIGCGQGEFLDLLCNLGQNDGIGFDPAFVAGKFAGSAKGSVRIVRDYYTEENTHQYPGDFVVCKMTLEHIYKTYEFVQMVSRSLRNSPDTVVFFQVPNAQRIFQEVAFWDIYYEHCSYFTPYALRHLFVQCGFEVLDLSIEYDRQYLTIEARLRNSTLPPPQTLTGKMVDFKEFITNFQSQYRKKFGFWNDYTSVLRQDGKKIALWGGGSKAVAFITSLNIGGVVDYIVDINPNKNGTFLVGTGDKIVSPDHLKKSRPDVMIVMNPIYMKEIAQRLLSLGVTTNLLPVDANTSRVV